MSQTYAQHPAMAALTGAEVIPGMQGGTTKQTTAAAIAALAAAGTGAYDVLPVAAAAGRALASADRAVPILYTGAASGTFTLATGFGTLPSRFRIIKGAAGVPTLTVATGVTLNGVDAGSVAVGATYSHLEIEALALNTFRVVTT